MDQRPKPFQFRLRALFFLAVLLGLFLGVATAPEGLSGMHHLVYLDLSNTPLTDHDLKYVGNVPTLQYLFLTDTKITDLGLGQLMNLSRLEVLELNSDHVTNAGVGRFQQALPKCRIERRLPTQTGP